MAILWKYSFMKGGQHYTLQLLETFRRMPTVEEFRGCNLVDLFLQKLIQWNLDLRKPDLRKNLDLRKIVGTTDFLVHKLFDLRKIF